MKQSPKLVPAVREVFTGTTMPPSCLEIVAHWIRLRFMEAPHVPRDDYGYFFWKKVYRDAERQVALGPQDTPPQLVYARMGASCAHCHDSFAEVFNDSANAWTYADAVVRGESLLHVDCQDLADCSASRIITSK